MATENHLGKSEGVCSRICHFDKMSIRTVKLIYTSHTIPCTHVRHGRRYFDHRIELLMLTLFNFFITLKMGLARAADRYMCKVK